MLETAANERTPRRVTTPTPSRTTTAPPPWVAWVEQARSGDRAAFARVYERFAPVVHGVLLGAVSRSEADDLTQEAFVRALRELPRLAEAAAFPAWILTIARNLAADRARAARPTVRLEASAASAPPAEEGASTGAARALAVIRGLPQAYRETLLMRLVEGLTGPQIAERTGLTEGSVRVNLSRGMALLRAELAGEGDER